MKATILGLEIRYRSSENGIIYNYLNFSANPKKVENKIPFGKTISYSVNELELKLAVEDALEKSKELMKEKNIQDVYLLRTCYINGYDDDYVEYHVIWVNGKWVDPYVWNHSY